jgi:ferredoxin
MNSTKNSFETFLETHDDAAWAKVIGDLLPSIHEVDKAATQIWFKFYPIDLLRALDAAVDRTVLEHDLLMKGNFYLKDQIDSSHHFLYGHRFWPEVRKAISEYGSTKVNAEETDLASHIVNISQDAALRLGVKKSLVIGITAAGLMTLSQVGMTAFRSAEGRMVLDSQRARLSAEYVLRKRAKDDSQGIFGFLKTIDKQWTITFDENQDDAKYKAYHEQDLAYAAKSDTRDYVTSDARCIEGPIPVECRSASCGTCWVGILGGAEKLAPVRKRESKKIKEFGYIDTDDEKPLIRLACQAQTFGAVSLVIPPWNGVFGKYLKSKGDAPVECDSVEEKAESVN